MASRRPCFLYRLPERNTQHTSRVPSGALTRNLPVHNPAHYPKNTRPPPDHGDGHETPIQSTRLRLQSQLLHNRVANKPRLGDRDLNPDYLIQSQAFCRLNYPPSQRFTPRILTHTIPPTQIPHPSEFPAKRSPTSLLTAVEPPVASSINRSLLPRALPETPPHAQAAPTSPHDRAPQYSQTEAATPSSR